MNTAETTLTSDALAAGPGDMPADELRFRRGLRPLASLREILQRRELIRTLAERDLRARYKQAILGFAWAVVTPLVLMVVFTVFFRRVAHVETGGVPYPVFSYVGLLPWTFFAGALSVGSLSLISNTSLLNKVYCPREVFPLASVVVATVDAAVSTLMLFVLFAITGFWPAATSYWVPVLLVVLFAFTIGTTLAFSALMVYLRDVRHVLPIILQLGLFATPVAFALSAIPSDARGIYSFLNPLAPVIDGLRRTVLYGEAPQMTQLALGATSAFLCLIVGYLLFRKLETGIADVA
jgi:ABC-2 type transport system permease protein/lipopolysaccharide transport system permease protein